MRLANCWIEDWKEDWKDDWKDDWKEDYIAMNVVLNVAVYQCCDENIMIRGISVDDLVIGVLMI